MSVRYQIVNDKIIELHTIVVHRFLIGDVDDLDIYAAPAIAKWLDSDAGKFVTENATHTPTIHKTVDAYSFYWNFSIVAELPKKKLSEFYLRFDKPKTF